MKICSGTYMCDVMHCNHRHEHKRVNVSCDTICMNQKDKGDFNCKDYNQVIRKEKLKKINES